MAIYRLHAQIISRSAGRSVVSAAAYRAGALLYDERLDQYYDHTNKLDVVHTEILLPEGAPNWMSDRQKLWNTVEFFEKRKDSQLAREVQITLPRELTFDQNKTLVQEFVKEQFVKLGMIADLAIHITQASDGMAQPHAHVLLTMRQLNENGFGLKVREWNDDKLLDHWRVQWGEYANKHLALNDHDIRIDHRSFKEQGIDLIPQKKIGPAAAFNQMAALEEHQRIARENGKRLLQKPEIAFDVLVKQQSTFTYQDMARVVNRYTADHDQFLNVFEKVKASPELVVLGKDHKGYDRYTTREMLKLESEMVDRAKVLHGISGHSLSNIDKIPIISNHSLSKEQGKVLDYIVDDGDLKCVVGFAGIGKSRLLGTARELWEKSGYRVLGATLSGIAAENLETSSGIESRTLASRFHYWDKDEELLTSKDILILDEAGMIDSRQMAKVLGHVVEHGAKVVLVGDPEQLQAIQAGAAFRAISDRTSYIELTEIWRQQVAWQKDATIQLATEKTAGAILKYAVHENVHEFNTQIEAKKALVSAWNNARILNSDNTQLMLAYTRANVLDLNITARVIRESLGELGESYTLQTERGERLFAEGDRIYFLQNDRILGVKNGTLGTLLGINNNTLKVEIQSEDNNDPKVIFFNLAHYNHFDYGYATTIHKSQGVTVDHCFLLASSYLDRHATYVGMTRHKENVALFWSKEEFKDYDAMVSSLSREKSKEFSGDYQEHDFAFYYGILAEKLSSFENKSEKSNSQDGVLDWKAMRREIEIQNPELAQEFTRLVTDDSEINPDTQNNLAKDKPDWYADLFFGFDKRKDTKEDLSDLFLGLNQNQDKKEDLSDLFLGLKTRDTKEDFSDLFIGLESKEENKDYLKDLFYGREQDIPNQKKLTNEIDLDDKEIEF